MSSPQYIADVGTVPRSIVLATSRPSHTRPCYASDAITSVPHVIASVIGTRCRRTQAVEILASQVND